MRFFLAPTAFLFIALFSGCSSLNSTLAGQEVVCAKGVTHAGYRLKTLRTRMDVYNADMGVTQLSATDRKKYEICYNETTKKLVRRDPNDLSKFLVFDTNTLDGSPYNLDYLTPTSAQVANRKTEKCDKKEASDKLKWHDSSEPVYHTATFAMDVRGNIYASTVFKKCVFHHSSYLSESPVAAAGEMRVDNGILKSINNKSGHYWPPAWTLGNLLDELSARGVDTTAVSCTSEPNSVSDPPGPPANCP